MQGQKEREQKINSACVCRRNILANIEGNIMMYGLTATAELIVSEVHMFYWLSIMLVGIRTMFYHAYQHVNAHPLLLFTVVISFNFN